MTDDIRGVALTPETEKRLLVGQAAAQRIWDYVRSEVADLDEFAAFACMNNLVIMHVGYADGRWPGFAQELLPVIGELLLEEDNDAPEE